MGLERVVPVAVEVEDVPIVVEKERFSLGAYRVGKLLVFKAKKGEPQWQERIVSDRRRRARRA